MIGFLQGQVIDKSLNSVLLNVNGVGYQVLVTARMAEKATLDSQQAVFTHLAVREDALTLYGFASVEEKGLFELLIGISGVGPKIGLAILSTYSPAEVQSAVTTENVSAFSAVSGIGKKNAERIVLELKNKVWSTAAFETGVSLGSDQLQQALTGLGYSPAESIAMAKGIDSDLPIQQQIKLALTNK